MGVELGRRIDAALRSGLIGRGRNSIAAFLLRLDAGPLLRIEE